MKHKSDYLSVFSTFKTEIELQSGHRIKTLRTDGGGEYHNNDAAQLLKACGIKHGSSAPYTPESNGRAERVNWSIVEGILALLTSSGAPRHLWPEAAQTWCFAKSRSPHAAVKGAVPEALFSGAPPSVAMLRPCGCAAWVTIPDAHRDKLEAKGAEFVHLGPDLNNKAWRVYEPLTGKIKLSSHVVFNERRLPLLAASPASAQSDVDVTTSAPRAVPSTLAQDLMSFDDAEDDLISFHDDGSLLMAESPPFSPSPSLASSTPTQTGGRQLQLAGAPPSVRPSAPSSSSEKSFTGSSGSATAPALESLSDDDLDVFEAPLDEWRVVQPAGHRAELREQSDEEGKLAEQREGRVELHGQSEGMDLAVPPPTLARDDGAPRSAKEALAGPHAQEWAEGIAAEKRQLRERFNAYTLILREDVPENAVIIGGKLVLRLKLDQLGNPKQFKARLVA